MTNITEIQENADLVAKMVENSIEHIAECLKVLEKQFYYQKEFKISRELKDHFINALIGSFVTQKTGENLSHDAQRFDRLEPDTQSSFAQSALREIVLNRINENNRALSGPQFKLP